MLKKIFSRKEEKATQDLQKQILHVLAEQDISAMECAKAKFRSIDPSHVRKKAYESYIDSLQGLIKSAIVSDFIRSEYGDKISESFKKLIESLDQEQPFLAHIEEKNGLLKRDHSSFFHDQGRELRKKRYNLPVKNVRRFLANLYRISYTMKDEGLSYIQPFENCSLAKIYFQAKPGDMKEAFEQFGDELIEMQRKENEAVK